MCSFSELELCILEYTVFNRNIYYTFVVFQTDCSVTILQMINDIFCFYSSLYPQDFGWSIRTRKINLYIFLFSQFNLFWK